MNETDRSRAAQEVHGFLLLTFHSELKAELEGWEVVLRGPTQLHSVTEPCEVGVKRAGSPPDIVNWDDRCSSLLMMLSD